MLLLGSKYVVSEEDMNVWRNKIYDLAFDCACIKERHMFYLLLIWIYEFIEVSVVNNTGEHAGLAPIKRMYPLYEDALTNLFRLRCEFVHSPYKIDKERLSRFSSDRSAINNVLCSLGFSKPVLNFEVHYFQ